MASGSKVIYPAQLKISKYANLLMTGYVALSVFPKNFVRGIRTGECLHRQQISHTSFSYNSYSTVYVEGM